MSVCEYLNSHLLISSTLLRLFAILEIVKLPRPLKVSCLEILARCTAMELKFGEG